MQSSINIYLDIDGVLINKDLSLANYANEFIDHILENYPESTYWLTTHCAGDASVPMRKLKGLFKPETEEKMHKIKPTNWRRGKADAIDLSKPFLWFDDNLFLIDREYLEIHNLLHNHIRVDLIKNPDMLRDFVADFPIPINSV